VTANVAPRLCAEFQDACLRRDYETARVLHDRLLPLHLALWNCAGTEPAKYALSLLGKCQETSRLPMVPLDETMRHTVRQAMMHAGLVETFTRAALIGAAANSPC
jgi:4-hydroxy-tetrahydrodipicolinate synthase